MKLVPVLTGQSAANDSIQSLLSLSVCLGGLGLPNLLEEASQQHSNSISILSPLIDAIVEGGHISVTNVIDEIITRKKSERWA